MRTRRTRLVPLLLLATVVLGCDRDQEPGMADNDAQQPTDLQAKPDPTALVPADRGEPPADLMMVDVVEGDGAEARPGSTVTVHYVGVSWSDGEQFDASWDRGQTFSFALGGGQVIAGWDQGVEGMRVGGRRILTIPPQLGYGERGAGGVIGPNETLVFAVDLLDVS